MKKILIVVLMTVLCSLSYGEELALWENDDLQGSNETAAADSSSVELASTPTLSRGAGSTIATFADTFAVRDTVANASLASAITDDSYFTFTLTPAVGKQISVTNLFVRHTWQNATVYTGNVAVMTSATGFTDGDEVALYTIGGSGSPSGWQNQSREFDLSGESSLQNVTGAIEVRLYYWEPTGTASQFDQFGIGRSFNTDALTDLLVTGETGSAVPPATTYRLK